MKIEAEEVCLLFWLYNYLTKQIYLPLDCRAVLQLGLLRNKIRKEFEKQEEEREKENEKSL